MADISIEVNGVKFTNPYVIGSGPPSTNFRTIDKAFSTGWSGVVAKTISLDSTPVMNVTPRYGKLKAPNGDIIGFENIELISDRSLDVWLDVFKRIKDKHPDKILIASLMESYEKSRWQDLTGIITETGVNMLELNFSCPHGHPETGMGAFMGQNPHIVEEVTRWVRDATDLPIWAKMTPDCTDIVAPSKAAFDGGADGIAAINTLPSIVGVDLENLRPLPTVEGHSTPGGFSYYAVKPLALRKISEIAKALPGKDISGIGGVISSQEAIEFILLGSSTVQVCTGVMLQGYEMIEELNQGLSDFLDKHGFKSLRDAVGHSLQYLTSHSNLVKMKMDRKIDALGTNRDEKWGNDITKETDNLASN